MMPKAEFVHRPPERRRVASGHKTQAGPLAAEAELRNHAQARSPPQARQQEATRRVRSARWREACRYGVRSWFTKRICLAVLVLAGVGSGVWAFGAIWIRAQNWPLLEGWVQRMAGA